MVSARSSESSVSANIRSNTASRWRRFNDLKAVTKISAVASAVLIGIKLTNDPQKLKPGRRP